MSLLVSSCTSDNPTSEIVVPEKLLTATPQSTTSIPDPTLAPTATGLSFGIKCLGGSLLVKGATAGYSEPRYYVVCEDGGISQQFSYDLGENAAVSPKGDLIAFAGNNGLVLTDVNGVVSKNISTGGRPLSPTWSSDGEYIAYTLPDSDQVQAIHVESNTLSQSLVPASFQHPNIIGGGGPPSFWKVDWSPLGTKITLKPTNYHTAYVVDIDCDSTTHQCSPRQLTSVSALIRDVPSWSPDGTMFAAICYGNTPPYFFCLFDSSGNSVNEYYPAISSTESGGLSSHVWSPDGKKIAFSMLDDNHHADIYAVNADGTGLMQLTQDPATDELPVWSPDGQKIAFVSSRDGSKNIYIMNSDGSGLVQLTHNASVYFDTRLIAWLPAEKVN